MDVRSFDLSAGATGACWIGTHAAFALGDGGVLFAGEDHQARHPAHAGAVLSSCVHPDGARLVTAGDDGRLCATDSSGAKQELFNANGKWIDHVVASAASGVIAAAFGKQVVVLRDDQEAHRFTCPTSVGGLALDAKGRRLAASHYGGVTLRYALMADDKGVTLKWAGSHLTVTLSPDADYIVTAMQENALHGWRMPEKIDLKMIGYPAKTRSLSWSKNARWLATSGADRAVIWPFVGKLGPQGKEPITLGERDALLTQVAFRPSEETLAMGYADGAVWLARLADRSVEETRAPTGAAVSALAWRSDGSALAVGDEAGAAAIVRLA